MSLFAIGTVLFRLQLGAKWVSCSHALKMLKHGLSVLRSYLCILAVLGSLIYEKMYTIVLQSTLKFASFLLL